MSRVFIILNGARRPWQSDGRLARKLVAVAEEAGHTVRLEVSRTASAGVELLHDARLWQAESVWIGGGDGTAHLLVNAALEDQFAIGVLPMGTVNALARCLGLPMNPVAAARILARARPRPFRPLMVAGRVALCFVSAGFDARVVHGVASVGGLKRWIGKYAYVVAALRQLLFLPRVPRFRVSVDATTPDGVTEFRNLLVSRILVYAGFRLFPGAAADPNHLQWYGLKGGTPADLALLMLRQRFEGAHEPHLAESLDILGAQPGATLHFQADGEAIDPGPGPFRVEVSPKPVWLLAPEGVPPGLSFDETESPS